ncbi:Transposon Ty3-G Gag-Pol poly, partial [Paramuricea clavata]
EKDYVYETVIQQFASHFVGRSNVILERARFNKCVQGKKESVIDFIEALYELAETCQFGDLTNELIGDRIVVGIQNASLSQKLMQDEKLTLDKAVKEAKSSELVKHHHNILQGDGEDGKINRLCKTKGRNKPKSPENSKGEQIFKLSKKVRSITEETDPKCSYSEDYFLGEISDHENKEDWSVNLSLGGTKVRFKIDTGADVTVIPEADYLRSGLPQLRSTSKTLFGPGQEKLSIKGVIKGVLKTSSLKETLQDIYVIGNLKEPLLGRPAIDALNLVQKVETIQDDESRLIEDEVKSTYPNLFKGLGEVDGDFSIKLKPDSKPFALTTPRRVAIPLLNKVKAELEKIENLGVISKVYVPTEWCAGMVVVPKLHGNIRICVDLMKLNENVLRETYPLPKIDNLLAQISESKIFTKLDCNSGFWQEKLDEQSRLLTT